MDSYLRATLMGLPSLANKNAHLSARPCKICDEEAYFYDVTDFWKRAQDFPYGPSGVLVQYFRCRYCGFMFTPFCDDWTVADFHDIIYNDEYKIVDPEYLNTRPQRLAERFSRILTEFKKKRILDYGSGAGIFEFNMNCSGFESVSSYDPFSSPGRPDGLFDIITCFEVIEHSISPIETLLDMVSFLAPEGFIILGVALQPLNINELRCNWWYCMPRNGHISFYSEDSLAIGALRAGLLFRPKDGLHILNGLSGANFGSLSNIISMPLFPISLGAPYADADPGWHGREKTPNGKPFRWTAVTTLSWTAVVPRVQELRFAVRIPFVNEIRPGYARDSRLFINGIEAKTSASNAAIRAEAIVSGQDAIEVMLQTPEPISPRELRGSPDGRRLGLAIEVPRLRS